MPLSEPMMNSFTESYLIFKVLSSDIKFIGLGELFRVLIRGSKSGKRMLSLGIFTPCSSIFFVVRRNIFDDGLE